MGEKSNVGVALGVDDLRNERLKGAVDANTKAKRANDQPVIAVLHQMSKADLEEKRCVS